MISARHTRFAHERNQSPPGTWAEYSICGWTEGKKRPRPTVGETRILDRGHVQCAHLNSHTSGLQSYERASIALASFC